MSSMLSAPAAIPATNEQIFAPALAPLSLGTLNRAWASSPRRARRARAITGTRPAADTRFGSSKIADATVGVWKSRIYEMPFLNRTTELQTSPIVPVQRGILALPHPPGTLTHRWIQAKAVLHPRAWALPANDRLRGAIDRWTAPTAHAGVSRSAWPNPTLS